MPINSGILSFGLVAILVKLYPAIKDQTVHLLHNKCDSRVRNQFWCPVCNETTMQTYKGYFIEGKAMLVHPFSREWYVGGDVLATGRLSSIV